jgi:AraC-like DNA-binding protein
VYDEHIPDPALRARVTCVWTQQRTLARVLPSHASPQAPRASTVTIVPDACTDIVWTGSELRVAGPDTRPMVEPLTSGAFVVGVRFHCGAGGSVLGAPLAALCDARVDLRALWGDDAERLIDRLHGRGHAEALVQIQRAVFARRDRWSPTDPLINALIDMLQRERTDPELRMTRIASKLGLSERQLQRRCVAAVGYAPKLLARILRMQSFREALRRTPDAALSTLAFELGFADQAHLSHESARLFGTSPSQLRKQAAKQPVSDFDKTAHVSARHTALHERAQIKRHAAR